MRWLLESKPPIWAKAAAELLGCVMFHFIGSLAPTAVGNGVALMTSVYYSAKVSGAHLNPAVTCVFCLLGHTNPLEAVFYIVAQIAGCVLGALLLAMVVPECHVGEQPGPGVLAGCFVPQPGLTTANVFVWEVLGTIMFIVPVMSVVWYTQNKSGYGNIGPIMVGISLISSALAVGDWTGAAFNPARVLGSAIVFDCAQHATTAAYIGGELLAAFIVPFFIAPVYSISDQAWYGAWLPRRMKTLLANSHSIRLCTVDACDTTITV